MRQMLATRSGSLLACSSALSLQVLPCRPPQHPAPTSHLHHALLDAPVAAAPEGGQREVKGLGASVAVLVLIKQGEVGAHQRLHRAGAWKYEVQ